MSGFLAPVTEKQGLDLVEDAAATAGLGRCDVLAHAISGRAAQRSGLASRLAEQGEHGADIGTAAAALFAADHIGLAGWSIRAPCAAPPWPWSSAAMVSAAEARGAAPPGDQGIAQRAGLVRNRSQRGCRGWRGDAAGRHQGRATPRNKNRLPTRCQCGHVAP
jgi:hypothetical protein